MVKTLLSLSLPLFLLVGCATSPYQGIDKKLRERSFQSIEDDLVKAKEDKYFKSRDKVLYYLDTGFTSYYLKEYQASIKNLSQAEYFIEDLYTKSVSRAISSWLVNDTVLEYEGEDYEDLYTNIVKSLAFIQQKNFESATVEIRRITNKLNLLEDKYAKRIERFNSESTGANQPKLEATPTQNRFHNDALAHYLGTILYREERAFDDARIERDKIVDAFQNQGDLYPFPLPKLPALKLPEGENGYLNILAFSGLSPIKDDLRITATYSQNWLTFSAQGYSESDMSNRFGFVPIFAPGLGSSGGGGFYSAEFPILQPRPNPVRRIRVTIAGEGVFYLEKLETLNTISAELFRLKMPFITLKTMIRVIGKQIAKEAAVRATEQSSNSGGLAIFGSLLGDATIALSEQADIRASHLLPADSYVVEVTLPKGDHTVVVDFLDKSGNSLYQESHDVSISDSLTLLNPFYF